MTEARADKAKNKIWVILFLLTWCAQMLAAVCFCCQKKGFHEDEYYTYYSTARTYGLAVEDGAWMERDAYFQEFVVLEGQGYQYGLVKLVQSWDVHPPVYYWIFHTVCSLFPGQFSKWFGLVINLAAFGISLFLLRYLTLLLTKRNEKLTWIVCLFYGFTPAAMSSVVFIRMYALLTVFVYLCAILHLKEIERYGSGGCYSQEALMPDGKPNGEKENMRRGRLSVTGFLLPLMIVTYLGFLTQYYYFIFLFFMAAAFCLYLLWKDRNLWNCIRYGCSLGIAFLTAYLTYPSCLGQMFRGQRGAQAAGNFFDLSNTFMRLQFFWRLMNEYVFGGLLPIIIVILLVLILLIVKKYVVNRTNPSCSFKTCEFGCERKLVIEKYRAYLLLLFTVSGYFFTVSKTALLLGNTSVRYQTPIYGIVVLLLFYALVELGGRFGNGKKMWLLLMAAALCLLVNMAGLFSGRVVFLYPENAEQTAFAKESAAKNIPVVYLYDAGQSWCVWDSADEFFEYDRIYFASQNEETPIADKEIAKSVELIVYLSNTAETENQLQRILNSAPNLTAYELRYREKYCDVYYFYE